MKLYKVIVADHTPFTSSSTDEEIQEFLRVMQVKETWDNTPCQDFSVHFHPFYKNNHYGYLTFSVILENRSKINGLSIINGYYDEEEKQVFEADGFVDVKQEMFSTIVKKLVDPNFYLPLYNYAKEEEFNTEKYNFIIPN